MKKLTLVLILAASLQACGTKGPLYLPSPQTKQTSAADVLIATTAAASEHSKGSGDSL